MTNPTNNGTDVDAAVALANQLANSILLALKTTHEYIKPRAESHGIKLSARDLHAWAVSLSIALSQSKAYTRLPATRVEVQKRKPIKRSEPPSQTIPFADPAVLPALRDLRELLKKDSIEEREIIRILEEAAPRGIRPPLSLDATPERSLRLLLDRWETVRELVEAGRPVVEGEAGPQKEENEKLRMA